MIVDCAHYRAGERQHERAARDRERGTRSPPRRSDDEFVWLGLRDPSAAELELAQRGFDLNELAVEDARHAHQRPKLEDYDGSVFIVLRTARYVDETESVEFGEIHLFLARHYAIAVRHGDGERAEARPAPARAVRAARARGRRRSPGRCSTRSSTTISPVVEGIDNDIQEVEQDIFARGDDSTERIYFLKREVIEFHRAVVAAAALAGGARARRLPADRRASCVATFATSPTTPGASTSRSTPSASC